VNPSTAFATVLADELVRCGLAEAVIAPGSRSAPLALALHDRASRGELRLHVRIDERSAAFLALGLAKASGRPAAVVCTSGTAAAHLHAAVIEADEAAVPLIVLTADRPPELRGTGANQTIDQLKLYGTAVRWFCEAGTPEARPGMNAYWRSLACRAWATAAGAGGGVPGPVHVNVPLREPLVPGLPDEAAGSGGDEWPESLDGRPEGAAWTSTRAPASWAVHPAPAAVLEIPWAERGVIVCGDGCRDPGALLRLAEEAGWPVLAEPSSGARSGPNALSAYPYLLGSSEFLAAHQPDVVVSAGRPGLSRQQLAFLRAAGPGGQAARPGARHVVIEQGPGRWADPGRSATDVAAGIVLAREGRGGAGDWLASWLAADAAARKAADELLDDGGDAAAPSEPRLARDLAAALPDGALLWAASSLPVRDLDLHMAPRSGLRVLASRGASGIDGLISSAAGAALAHQAAGGGPTVALLGDLAFLHDLPGLVLGPAEARPDLTLLVVNNDGGGIFSLLEQAGLGEPFERLFGTPHGASLGLFAAGVGVPYARLERAGDLAGALRGRAGGAGGGGLRVLEMRTGRAAGAVLRGRLRDACAGVIGPQASRTLGSSSA
jgi:2-succinyl-5-enolpyruvyl-6-hydroxy-3-cyclohexene-1-carboxylate synthase